jgi:hypothetical protein
MNDHDKDNLEFLMAISKNTLLDWCDQASDDDIQYAIELLKQRQIEVDMELATVLDDVEDVTEAKTVLSKYSINK